MNSKPGRIFDTHAHIMSNDPAKYPPSAEGRASGLPPYTAAELVADMDVCNVPRACSVQRYHYYFVDNSYVLDASIPFSKRLTPVVMLNGQDPESPDILRRIVAKQPISALRFACPTIDTYDTGWMHSQQTLRLWETAAKLDLPVAIILYRAHLAWNLPALKMVVEMFPEMTIVVDHLATNHSTRAEIGRLKAAGKPVPYVGPPEYAISLALKELRPFRNVHFKFTGINLECLEENGVPYAEFLRRFVDEFGANKLVVGTDIGQTRGPYARITGALREATGLLNDEERDMVLYGNANRIFGRHLDD